MNITKKGLLISAAAFASSIALAGQAPEQDPSVEMPSEAPEFEQIDANADGLITITEAQDTWLAENFEQADADQDGAVTRTEYDNVKS